METGGDLIFFKSKILSEHYGNIVRLNIMYEWNIEINDIKRIEIVDTPIGDGVNGSEITFAFRENYFQKNDTFEIEETRQQFFVTAGPTRQNDQYWVIQARIIDGDFNTVLDDSISYVGGFAKWIGNAFKKFQFIYKLAA